METYTVYYAIVIIEILLAVIFAIRNHILKKKCDLSNQKNQWTLYLVTAVINGFSVTGSLLGWILVSMLIVGFGGIYALKEQTSKGQYLVYRLLVPGIFICLIDLCKYFITADYLLVVYPTFLLAAIALSRGGHVTAIRSRSHQVLINLGGLVLAFVMLFVMVSLDIETTRPQERDVLRYVEKTLEVEASITSDLMCTRYDSVAISVYDQTHNSHMAVTYFMGIPWTYDMDN